MIHLNEQLRILQNLVVGSGNTISVTTVSILPETASIDVGSTTQLIETVLPANATDKTGVWSSANDSVATVSVSGLVSGVTSGSTTITFTTNDGSFTDNSVITVDEVIIPVTSVSISPTTDSIITGNTTQLTETVLPANATDKTGVWSSSNTGVATVTSGGLVSGITSGSTIITFTTNDGSFTDVSTITVNNAVVSVTSVSVSPASDTIITGGTTQLTETVLPANATDKTGVWSSSNTGVATVTSGGLVSGITSGSTIITFTTNDGSFTDTSTITVSEIYGFGKETTGGEGGTLYTVTNLNTSGAGSLADAVGQTGARIIKFAVSGDIDYGDVGTLVIVNDDITIDGSDAPDGGICIKGVEVRIRASNVIIKHIRIRLGDNGYKNAAGQVVGSDGSDVGCLLLDGSTNGAISDIVIQNCSLSWSIDEVLDMWTGGVTGNINNVTIQRCIIAEALKNSHHTEGAHSMSVLMNGATNVSFYKNYFAHANERHLRTQNESTFELVNNLFYNITSTGVYGHGCDFDIVNNHFKEGNNPFTSTKLTNDTADGAFTVADSDVHIVGNTNDGGLTEVDSDYVARQQGSTAVASTILPVLNNAAMISDILDKAGAYFPIRDSADTRVINDYINNTGNIIDTQEEVGGYPILTELEPSNEIYGFGRFTTGGTGGASIVVTNLNTSGPGSLREAIDTAGVRTITFSVSGNIDWGAGNNYLNINIPNLTIDGSTAPNGGICLKGVIVTINASNVIIKHIRVRRGDVLFSRDAIQIAAVTSSIENVVIDHVSASWASDECLSITATGGYSVTNVTVQYSILAQGIESDGYFSKSTLISGTAPSRVDNITFYKNYMCHNDERHIRANELTSLEIVNNVFYNVGSTNRTTDGCRFDLINNHYKEGNNPFGTDTIAKNVVTSNINPDTGVAYVVADTDCYINGNTNDGGLAEMEADYIAINSSNSVMATTITPDTVADAIVDVLANVGATLPKRDTLDVEYIDDYNNGTGNWLPETPTVLTYPDLTI